jgi:DNA-binding response OmpR family regulator/DNA-binding CsgD family transcriptional regulator
MIGRPGSSLRERPLILLVEDEDDLRSDLVEELQAAHYRVLEAADGQEALAILDCERPDLILCDITMPGLGGYEVLADLRQKRPHLAEVPFIFLTALANRRDVIQGKRAGADDYLVKPIDFDVLLATVQARLDQVIRMRSHAESDKTALLELAARRASEIFGQMAETLNRLAAGVILLDSTERIVFVNAVARQILDEDDGLAMTPGGLRGSFLQESQAIKQLLRCIDEPSTGEGRARGLALRRPSGRRPLLLFACAITNERPRDPTQPTFAVFVTDPEQRPRWREDLARDLYGLTAAEARVALSLAEGKRLDEIAEDFGVAQTTITFHLRNLFAKTQTSRQADLIALFLISPIAFDQPER